MAKRIALIVDNPSRDLDGYVLLACELAKRGHEAFLVPMYSQRFEIPLIAPDIVVLNFLRKSNAALARAYKKAGIKIAVLDTEGGICESPDQFVRNMLYEKVPELVDTYFLWGRSQHDALSAKLGQISTDLMVTGCPRFDYYRTPYKRTLLPFRSELSPYVLVVSSFALAYPRYVSAETEVENMVTCGKPREKVLARLEEETAARASLIKFLRVLATRYPNINFVVRPHPFESEKQYEVAFSEIENLHVIREGTVGPWVSNADTILHLNSSVSVDSHLMGKQAISMEWLCGTAIREMSEVSFGISGKAKTEEEVFQIIEKIRAPAMPSEKAVNELRNWFDNSKESSSSQVAEALSQVSVHRNKNRFQLAAMSLFGSVSPFSPRGWLEGTNRLVWGGRSTEYLRSVLFTRNFARGTRWSKFFSTKDVENVHRRLKEIGEFDSLQVGPLRFSDMIIPARSCMSVRLSK